jgi:hypothetical protein
MIVEVASICDAATANGTGGRLNILGAFDRVFSQFPLVIPQCAAAFRIRYQRAEAGVHKLVLAIEDVCGHAIVPGMESNIPFEPVAKGFDTAAVNLILNMQRLKIERPDKYIVRLFIDDEEYAALPLYALEAPQSAPSEPSDGEVKN